MPAPTEVLKRQPDRLVPPDFKSNPRHELFVALTSPPDDGYPIRTDRQKMSPEEIREWRRSGMDFRRVRKQDTTGRITNLLMTHSNYLKGLREGKARVDDGEQNFHNITFRKSLLGEYQRDSRGVPLHPEHELILNIRAAVVGPGWYYDYGPNPSAQAIVLAVDQNNKLNLAVMSRVGNDTRIFLPGGMVEQNDSANETAIRETREEVSLDLDTKEYDTYELPTKVLGTRRTTLNSWEESTSVAYFVQGFPDQHPLKADEDETKEAKWETLTPDILNKLFLPHANDVRLAILEYERRNTCYIGRDGTIHKLPQPISI